MIKQFFKEKKATLEEFKVELLKDTIDTVLLDKMFGQLGIDIDEPRYKGQTLLHETITKKKFNSSFWLIQHGANVALRNQSEKNSLDLAIDLENTKLVKLILSLEQINIDEKDKDGRTYLQNLVVLGHNDLAQIFIEEGADINSQDNNGRNVIFDALSYGNEKFIDYLLEINKVNLNIIDNNKNSIMHHREVYSNDTIAKKLIQKGADPTIKNESGETYLCNAALRGMEAYDIISTAIDHGADLNSRVSNENTILMELVHTAARLTDGEKKRRESLYEMSKEVVLKGIKINAIDANGETALFRAIRLNDIELTKFLLENKMDPNIQNHDMQSALHIAVYHGIEYLDILLVLLRYGASPLVKNNAGQTIYEILNELILHTHGKITIENKQLLSKLKQDGQYIIILKELLQHNTSDLNFLDSTGSPLFFKPLLEDHYQLFRLYIKYGLDIHAKNNQNHNILTEYILKVFNDNKNNKNFQNNLTMLISSKIEHNVQDETGYTIVQKVLGTPCNIHLFDTLTDVILFDYSLTDYLGRSAMHTAIWHDQGMIMKRIHNIDTKVINIPDGYGILPITYAALLGNQRLVHILLELGSNVKSNVEIKQQAIEKFQPMLKNLDQLNKNIGESELLRKMDILIDQVKRDFKAI